MQVSPILRKTITGFSHWCPACEEIHVLPDSWIFDGDVNTPTFSPSFKHTFYRWEGEPGSAQARATKRELVCHYIITAGKIQFCPDSWHKRSDIVSMPLIPEGMIDD